jgi:hypothetical protein
MHECGWYEYKLLEFFFTTIKSGFCVKVLQSIVLYFFKLYKNI